MKRNYCLFCLLAMALFACVSKKQKAHTINLSGAFALYPMVVKWAEVYQQEHPEIRFNISAGGAGKGMADALAGTVDLGMFSREIAPQEKQQGVWWVGLCKDAVLPTVSANHPDIAALLKRGMSQVEFRALFVEGTINHWNQLKGLSDQNLIQVYTRADACGAAGTWAAYLDARQENLNGVGIHGDPALAEAVAKDVEGIAFNNTAFVYDVQNGHKRPGLEVVPIDLNANGQIDSEEAFYQSFGGVLEAITTGVYPSPPARELYFVAREKPQKQATIEFIRWALTEGQAFVKEAGYVPVTSDKLEAYLLKLQ